MKNYDKLRILVGKALELHIPGCKSCGCKSVKKRPFTRTFYGMCLCSDSLLQNTNVFHM